MQNQKKMHQTAFPELKTEHYKNNDVLIYY